MEKNRKRIIRCIGALILSAVLLAGEVPVSAFAADNNLQMSAGEVADAMQGIVTAYTEVTADDLPALEDLQNDIWDVTAAYEALSAEDQAQLSHSMGYVRAVAAQIETMTVAVNSVMQDGSIDLIEDGVENSWRYLNGEAIADILDVIEQEAKSVSGEETAADIPCGDQGDDEFSDESTDVKEDTEVFDQLVGKSATYEGIDVSHHQGYIDWQEVKNAGIDFAIIRCGYGSNLSSQDDRRWEYNASSCESLGIPYGVYLYSHAGSTAEIDGEVQHVLRLLKGHTPTLPVYIDIEENSQFALGSAVLCSMAERFCSQMVNAGYKSGLYSSVSYWNAYFGTFAEKSSYYHWVAQYNSSCNYSGRYETWQYSNTGRVNGITGNVDRDEWYGRFNELDPEQITPTPISYRFSDVRDPKHPYYKAICWAADAGIAKGYSDGTFGIDRECTRSEAVMFLWRMAGKPTTADEFSCPFSDVPKSHPHYKAILWASREGITKGYSDGTFGIDGTCTRGQMMTFIWRFKGKPAPKAVSSSPFSDVPKNHAYYKAILWGAQNKVTNGFSDGTFGIDKDCTRGQTVTFLYRIK